VAYITAHGTLLTTENDRIMGSFMFDPRWFIPLINDFKTIVDLCSSLTSASTLNFSLDMGIVGALFMCCCKCSDHTVQLAALDILQRCPRREGMWDSTMMIELIKLRGN
jgi:hypothetical protein